MQALISGIVDGSELDSPDVRGAIDQFNDKLWAQGYWVDAHGLAEPGTATVVDNHGVAVVFTDSFSWNQRTR